MMNRIDQLFAKKKTNVLNVYCTAGYPHLNSTTEVLNALQQNGADLIEIGMPYSDPLADGPVIQASSSIALQNGMTISKLFSQLKDLRKEIDLPLILMGYLNPVLQFGFEKLLLNDAITRMTIGGSYKTIGKAWAQNKRVIRAGQTDAFVTALYKGKRIFLEELEAMGIFK